jgi:hypothetical protein
MALSKVGPAFWSRLPSGPQAWSRVVRQVPPAGRPAGPEAHRAGVDPARPAGGGHVHTKRTAEAWLERTLAEAAAGQLAIQRRPDDDRRDAAVPAARRTHTRMSAARRGARAAWSAVSSGSSGCTPTSGAVRRSSEVRTETRTGSAPPRSWLCRSTSQLARPASRVRHESLSIPALQPLEPVPPSSPS